MTATSTTSAKVKASVFIYLIASGPTITAVSPDPIAVGSLTVTIQGSGFLPGAMVYDNYGTIGAVQYAAQSVAPTAITASIYQGNASFGDVQRSKSRLGLQQYDHRPGHERSAAPAAGVHSQRRQWQRQRLLRRRQGRDDHRQRAARRTEFRRWTGASVANPASATTTLTMPAANVTVTATFTSGPPPPPTYALTVVNGSGSGSYPAGQVVTITANPAPAGQTFANWTGATVANASASRPR